MGQLDDVAILRIGGLVETAIHRLRAGELDSVRLIRAHVLSDFGEEALLVFQQAITQPFLAPREPQKRPSPTERERAHAEREGMLDALWEKALNGHEPARRRLMVIAALSPHCAGRALEVFEAAMRLPSWNAARIEVGASTSDVDRAKRLLIDTSEDTFQDSLKSRVEMKRAADWLRAERSEPHHLVEEDSALERLGE